MKAKWVLHAYVVMSNHYHLALETPEGNLVEGMKWLQSTFANRYNRYRNERGHVFQGRYKAILVEELSGLGAVAHYIHLNPVRARLASVGRLEEYRHSSYRLLQRPRERPSCLGVQSCLEAAGQLADTPAGRRNYAEYLAWLSENGPAQKQLKFEAMTKGWALGSPAFKKALVEDHKQRVLSVRMEADTQEVKALLWEELIQKALQALGKTSADVTEDRKSAPWKVAIATHVKTITSATNPWLGKRLRMGAPAGVSRYVSELKQKKRTGHELLLKISNIKVWAGPDLTDTRLGQTKES
jgi:hypothetical protein